MSSGPAIGTAEPGTLGAAALSAARASRDAEDAERVAAGEDLTSLNRLLQWGAANTTDRETAAAAAAELSGRTPNQLREDREWLDVAFPDMYADVKRLSGLLAESSGPGKASESESAPEISDDERIEILQGLEEYMADLNYATNITKLGTLRVVVENASHSNPEVRAAALWVLATSMQNHADVKDQVIEGGAMELIVAGLRDAHASPRAKACMAASALLKHASDKIHNLFAEATGIEPLKKTVVDDATPVRRKAQFMLRHAAPTGLSWFVDEVLKDQALVRRLVEHLEKNASTDESDVISVCGALRALADHDRISLLETAPSLPGVIGEVRAAVSDLETREELDGLLAQLFSTIP